MLGRQGPDQGYAYRLVTHLDAELHLGRVNRQDAVAGCVAIATKRSSLFGRAPVVHDLRAAFSVFGFLDPSPPVELVVLREQLFSEVRSNHHYAERRELVDLVPDRALLQSPASISAAYASDWRSNFGDLDLVSH